ncbi:hypothetical protein PENANT_c132G08790 [Penicillium antarcticum]|uniref:Uncharacterized protein n=1 Tax=Penicillium antarcticum TaxID=416450 RepID=A0A1V6PGU6_9EURO|nr:hypothetical protein PENANT_c132G08790 [Penicillium antarcticum]
MMQPDWWPAELDYRAPEQFEEYDLRNAVFTMLRKADSEQFRKALAPLKTRSVNKRVLRLVSLLTQIESSGLETLKALAASFGGSVNTMAQVRQYNGPSASIQWPKCGKSRRRNLREHVLEACCLNGFSQAPRWCSLNFIGLLVSMFDDAPLSQFNKLTGNEVISGVLRCILELD